MRIIYKKSSYLFILFTFCSKLMLGQELVLKTIEHPEDKSQEVFHVLKNDSTIKEGAYQYLNSNGKIILEGRYIHDKKDGIWIGYNHDSSEKQYLGEYKRGVAVSEWKYFYKGKVNMIYDYSKNELTAFSQNDSLMRAFTLEINGNDTIKKFTDHPAMYIGGELFLLEYIRNNIEYPIYAKRNKIQGNIYIGFTIDEKGKAINHRVLREIGGGCDQEAMSVVRRISDNWIPAISNGKPVNSYLTVPVSFRMGK